MNRPRAWEEKLLLANEKPKEKGFKAIAKSPITRLVGVVLIFAALVSVVVFGFVMPRQINIIPTQTNHARSIADLHDHAHRIWRNRRPDKILYGSHAVVDVTS